MPWREQLKCEHALRTRENLWRKRTSIDGPQGRHVQVGGKTFLNFCSNDYLGLAGHPELSRTAIEAIDQWGTGAGASHLVCGHLAIHDQLESDLAKFVKAERAILFSTGYMANLAIPTTFLGRHDLVLEDRLNHASLIDAGRICDAILKRYPHVDLVTLKKKLAGTTATRKMVLSDGVFSMDGDIAPVEAMQAICNEQDAMLVIDDAHGFGVLGEQGAGTLESAGLRPTGNVLLMGTFGKSLGSFGAFVAGDEIYIESLIQFARSYIYTTAIPPSVAATTLTALKIIQDEPIRRDRLEQNITYYKNAIQSVELTRLDSSTPIQPILLGTSTFALEASRLLKANGIWVSAIRPPTVPAGSARLRIALTAQHRFEDIDRLVSILKSDSMRRIVKEGNE